MISLERAASPFEGEVVVDITPTFAAGMRVPLRAHLDNNRGFISRDLVGETEKVNSLGTAHAYSLYRKTSGFY